MKFADSKHLNAVANGLKMATLAADHVLRFALLVDDLTETLRYIIYGIACLLGKKLL